MKTKIIIAILLITLTACSSTQPSADVANTAIDIAQTGVAFTPTATVVVPTPSPLPTEPIIPMITPDAIQVEKWKEYQTALAKTIMSYEFALCEWEILGQSEQEIYVWATCRILDNGADAPAVIHVDINGTIQNVEIPGTNWSSDIREMFPVEIQKIVLNNLMNYRQLSDHLKWRMEHPDDPPLIVLLATPTATPTP